MAALSSTSGSISFALIARPRACESFCGDRLGIPFKVNLGDQSQFSRKYRSPFRLTRSIAATAQQLHRKCSSRKYLTHRAELFDTCEPSSYPQGFTVQKAGIIQGLSPTW